MNVKDARRMTDEYRAKNKDALDKHITMVENDIKEAINSGNTSYRYRIYSMYDYAQEVFAEKGFKVERLIHHTNGGTYHEVLISWNSEDIGTYKASESEHEQYVRLMKKYEPWRERLKCI